MKFKYLKGSEKDFEGAPGWCTEIIYGSGVYFFAENFDYMCKAVAKDEIFGGADTRISNPTLFKIIAQREPISEPEKLGHGLDCEECKPINTGDCVIMDGRRYIVGDEITASLKHVPECTAEERKPREGFISQAIKQNHKEVKSLISDVLDGAIRRQLHKQAERVMVKPKDRGALTVTVTAEEMRPTIQKLIDDFTNQPIELSLQIVNGRPVISDQFGRVVKNYATVNYNSDKDISAQAAISVKFKETK